MQKNINCMAVGGRLVYIAFLKGAQVEINLMNPMLKRQTITGSTLRIRSVAEGGHWCGAEGNRLAVDFGRENPPGDRPDICLYSMPLAPMPAWMTATIWAKLSSPSDAAPF